MGAGVLCVVDGWVLLPTWMEVVLSRPYEASVIPFLLFIFQRTVMKPLVATVFEDDALTASSH